MMDKDFSRWDENQDLYALFPLSTCGEDHHLILSRRPAMGIRERRLSNGAVSWQKAPPPPPNVSPAHLARAAGRPGRTMRPGRGPNGLQTLAGSSLRPSTSPPFSLSLPLSLRESDFHCFVQLLSPLPFFTALIVSRGIWP